MKNFNLLLYFFISLFFAGLLWASVSIFLPKIPIIYTPIKNDVNFFRIDFRDVFIEENIMQKRKPIKKQIQNYSINGLKLKAIYNNGDKGFIVVEDKTTHFIDFGHFYRGYKLTKIGKDFVEFTKNGRIYKLTFKVLENKMKSYNVTKNHIENVEKVISKKVLLDYKNNLSKVWDNISIVNDRRGYRISYIKNNSIFRRIGLKKGDIIVKVNGKKLLNDADAWNIYKNVQKYDNFEIEIIRNNRKKVLNYEVD